MQSHQDHNHGVDNATTLAPPANPGSNRKAEQARLNGAKSKGPTSAQGKSQSSKNAYKHGLTAKNIVPSNQNGEFFNEMLAAFRHDFDPATLAEVQCIDRMAHAALNQNSAGIEITALINHKRIQMASTTHTDPTMPEQLRNALAVEALVTEGPTFDNYQRYLRDADRRYSRALRDLILLRKSLRHDAATNLDDHAARPAFASAPSPALRPILTESDTPAAAGLASPPPTPGQPHAPTNQDTYMPEPTPDTQFETRPLASAPAANPPSVPSPVIAPGKNEPTEVAENTEAAPDETHPESALPSPTPAPIFASDSYSGAIPTPPAPQKRENQPVSTNQQDAPPSAGPEGDYREREWSSIMRIRTVLYAFPDAYKAVSEALRDLPKEDYFL